MEDILSKLDSIYSVLTGLLAFVGFSFVAILFIFLILFFQEYDRNKKEEKKRITDEIKREIKDNK